MTSAVSSLATAALGVWPARGSGWGAISVTDLIPDYLVNRFTSASHRSLDPLRGFGRGGRPAGTTPASPVHGDDAQAEVPPGDSRPPRRADQARQGPLVRPGRDGLGQVRVRARVLGQHPGD